MASSIDHELVLTGSKAWIEKFIIALNICPFAGPSYKQNKIEYQIEETGKLEIIIESFLMLLSKMLDSNNISNSFLILAIDQDFENYLDIFNTCEDLLIESETDQLFQLASFHPKYQYDRLEVDDIANFRNRSPFAMIHLLRVEEVEQAIEGYKNTLEIPELNAEKLRELGRVKLMEILQSISQTY